MNHTYQQIQHGTEQIGTTLYHVSNVQGITRPPEVTVVIAPGWVGGQQTCAGFAEELAAASKGQMEVLTYDEPSVGNGAYSSSYRAERFEHVVRQITGARSLLALGHSRGWLTVMDAAENVPFKGNIQALTALTFPIGNNVLAGPIRTTRGVAAEILTAPFAVSRPHVRRGLGTIGLVAARGIAHGLLHPVWAARQLNETFQSDVIQRTVDLSEKVPTLTVYGSRDRLVPWFPVSQSLEEAGYQGKHLALPVTHVGALVNYRYMPKLYMALHGLVSDELKSA